MKKREDVSIFANDDGRVGGIEQKGEKLISLGFVQTGDIKNINNLKIDRVGDFFHGDIFWLLRDDIGEGRLNFQNKVQC